MPTDIATKPNTIPQRHDVNAEHTWKLTDIYPNDESWEADYKKVQSLIEEAKTYNGRLGKLAKTLYACLEARSDISIIMMNLYQYAYLSKDVDNRVSKYQAMTQRGMMLSAQAGAAFSFIEPELLKLDEKKLRALAAKFPRTDYYDFYIEELIRSKAHVRSEEVEELLAMSSVVARGPDTIFSMFDDADIKYPSIIDEDSNEIKLTKQRYAKLIESKDRRVRKESHEAFYAPYKEHVNTLGASLASSVNKDVFYTKARRFNTCLERALDGDNIPLSVYHSLLDTTESNLAGLHDYVRLRKKILKLDEIYPYDMVCPLFPDMERQTPYAEAVRQVIEASKPLGEKYVSSLSKAFSTRWVDVFETEGKGGGAYSWGNYSTHPFVLMNYNDTTDSMFTLAHEMGHAMHSALANAAQPYPKAHYSIFVAEVASTLNEGLLMQLMLKGTDNPKEKLSLLNRYIDMTMGTFFNQIMYARFELMIHSEVEKGGALSPDIMSEMYRNLTQQYFGPDLVVDEFAPLKWCRIPHFYNMYYVYQYSTSYAASQAILTKFINGEKGIIDKYLEMLSSGGKDHPIELLKICGIDMATPDPVRATLNLFKTQVAEMEKLAL